MLPRRSQHTKRSVATSNKRPEKQGGKSRLAQRRVAVFLKSAMTCHFWPLNVGCAIPGGISVLSLRFSMLTFKRPDLTYIKVD